MIMRSLLNSKSHQTINIVSKPLSEEHIVVQIGVYGIVGIFILLSLPAFWHFAKITWKLVTGKYSRNKT